MQNNPSALAHQLRIGTALPSSAPGPGQSVALISSKFNNLGAIGYYRKKVISDAPRKSGTDKFILDYLTFLQECPNYVQNFQINHDVAIISVQTPFLRELFGGLNQFLPPVSSEDDMKSHIPELNEEDPFNIPGSNELVITGTTSQQIPSIFQHGMITDAAHKFFYNGKLLQTCVYFEVLHRWQPILFSWIGKENKETYASHFFSLFTSIALQILECQPEMRLAEFHSIISSLIDFLDVQRSGFETAYERFVTSTQPGVQLLMREWQSDFYQFPSIGDHRSVARGLLKGRQQHWKESVSRIS